MVIVDKFWKNVFVPCSKPIFTLLTVENDLKHVAGVNGIFK